MLDDFGMNEGQCPVQNFFWILIVHKLITPYPKDQSAKFFLVHQPVRVKVTVTACVVNKVLISNSIFMEQSAQPWLTIQ